MAKKQKAAATTQPAGPTHVRVEVHCARCEPCVFVTTVLVGPDGTPDQDELRAAILAAGWTVNQGHQAICSDCR